MISGHEQGFHPTMAVTRLDFFYAGDNIATWLLDISTEL